MTTSTLVLLPGLLCDAAAWEAQCQTLVEAKCVVPRLPSAGSITGIAEGVLATVDRPRFALAGHSMGARVALEIVRLAPDRVERLALFDTGLDPIARGPDGERERAGRFALLETARTLGMREMGRRWAHDMVHPTHRDTAVFEAILDMVERNTTDRFESQIIALLGRPDARSVLSSVRCPTLIGCGRQDAWSPLARHEQMHSALAHSTLVVIEDSGHMTPMEQPAAVTRALRSWLTVEA